MSQVKTLCAALEARYSKPAKGNSIRTKGKTRQWTRHTDEAITPSLSRLTNALNSLHLSIKELVKSLTLVFIIDYYPNFR